MIKEIGTYSTITLIECAMKLQNVMHATKVKLLQHYSNIISYSILYTKAGR